MAVDGDDVRPTCDELGLPGSWYSGRQYIDDRKLSISKQTTIDDNI
jgi:hypothetical protein